MGTTKSLVIAAAIMACVGGTWAFATPGVALPPRGPVAQQELTKAFPGIRIYQDQGRTRIIYGKSMTTARSPRLAAEKWLADHSDAFGAGTLELVEEFAGPMKNGAFFVFMYHQTINGVPVELSPGRVLVHNNGDGTWSVVYAAGLFVGQPEGGFAPMTRTGQDAVNFIRSSQQFGGLPQWSDAQLAIYQLPTEAGFQAVRA